MNFGGEFYGDIHVNEFKPTCLKFKNRLCHSNEFRLFVSLVCVWKYSNLFYKCIMEGTAVVAIAHGIDTGPTAAIRLSPIRQTLSIKSEKRYMMPMRNI